MYVYTFFLIIFQIQSMFQSWAGNSEGLFYCTRKYYGDELEGQQSYFDYLQVNYAQPHAITRYKVCSGEKTHSVVPRSWVVEVSGIPPSHTLNKVREVLMMQVGGTRVTFNPDSNMKLQAWIMVVH